MYDDGATFVPVCSKCGRYVKADESVSTNDNSVDNPNATCKRCGRTQMVFEGFYDVGAVE